MRGICLDGWFFKRGGWGEGDSSRESEVSAIEEKGEFTGFDFLVDGKVVAPIRLSSNNFITSGKVEVKDEGKSKTLIFERV